VRFLVIIPCRHPHELAQPAPQRLLADAKSLLEVANSAGVEGMGFGISTCKLLAMMTLRNMRQRGVHSLAIHCGALWCNHEAILDVSTYADGMTVPSFGPRMVWCAAQSALMRDLIGMNVRPPVCLDRD
jgi:hypothetical protein